MKNERVDNFTRWLSTTFWCIGTLILIALYFVEPVSANNANFTSSCTTTCSSTYGAPYTCGKAVDGNTDPGGTAWASETVTNPTSEWIKCSLSSPKTLSNFHYWPEIDRIGNYKIQGSNDDSEWYDLFTNTSDSAHGDHNDAVSSTASYTYYRMLVNSMITESASQVALFEVQLFGDTPSEPTPTLTPTVTPTPTAGPTPTGPTLTPTPTNSYQVTGTGYDLILKTDTSSCIPQGTFTPDLWNNPSNTQSVCQSGMRSSGTYTEIQANLLAALPKDQGNVFYYTASVLTSDTVGQEYIDMAVGYGYMGSGTNGRNFGVYIWKSSNWSTTGKIDIHYQYWDASNAQNATATITRSGLTNDTTHDFSFIYAFGNFGLVIDGGAPEFYAPVPHNNFYNWDTFTCTNANPYLHTGASCYTLGSPTTITGDGTDFSHATFNVQVEGIERLSEISANIKSVRNSALIQIGSGGTAGGQGGNTPTTDEICKLPAPFSLTNFNIGEWVVWGVCSAFVPDTKSWEVLKDRYDGLVTIMETRAPLSYVVGPFVYLAGENFNSNPGTATFDINWGSALADTSFTGKTWHLDLKPDTALQSYIDTNLKPFMSYIVDLSFVILWVGIAAELFGIKSLIGGKR